MADKKGNGEQTLSPCHRPQSSLEYQAVAPDLLRRSPNDLPPAKSSRPLAAFSNARDDGLHFRLYNQ